MKRCPKCSQEKPDKQFGRQGKYLRGYCKPCQSEYLRAIRDRNRWWLDMYKRSHGCEECGKRCSVRQLDIHHTIPSLKTIKPADMVREKWSIERMKEELEHCQVLCKRCHKIAHGGRPTFGTSGMYAEEPA